MNIKASKSSENSGKVAKSSKITIQVDRDEQGFPVRMDWEATDNPTVKGNQECKAMLLSLFDKEHKDTFKLDLWTKDMQVVEMDRFFYNTLKGMADSYFKATQNHKLASNMQLFAKYFGEETEILQRE